MNKNNSNIIIIFIPNFQKEKNQVLKEHSSLSKSLILF